MILDDPSHLCMAFEEDILAVIFFEIKLLTKLSYKVRVVIEF